MFRKSLSILSFAVAAALPLAAGAQTYNQGYNAQAVGSTLLPSQSVITGTLEQSLNSKSANPSDTFVLDVRSPYPGDDQRFAGGHVYGHVANVTHASTTHKGAVTLAFDRLVLSDGTAASLTGDVVSVDAQGNKANTTAKTIAGAVVGQIVGNYIGKHIGTNIGGAVGAIGGGILANKSGQNITLAQGSNVSLKTTSNATVLSRRQSGPYASPTPY